MKANKALTLTYATSMEGLKVMAALLREDIPFSYNRRDDDTFVLVLTLGKQKGKKLLTELNLMP